MRGTARDLMVAETTGRFHMRSDYGWIQAMDSAGAIAGPLLALSLLPHYGQRGVFWAAGIPGLLCIVVAVVGIREPKILWHQVSAPDQVNRCELVSKQKDDKARLLAFRVLFILCSQP